ncbi:MAG: aldehyde dehydrogenase EutE [Defluviitaleaceae bacterium]|nr:aldehyde dehydrogenase EutE [Defluviitaleaceae bacterium]
MQISEKLIREIVERVVGQMGADAGNLGIFEGMEDAISAAKSAQRIVHNLSMAGREKIIAAIRAATVENAEILARMAVEETSMGNVAHKIAKHHLLAEKTPGTEDIQTRAWSGDAGLTLVEMSPFGVIGAITPSTNPSETIICNTIGMLAGGNTVVFNPHPAAAKTSVFAIDMINRASQAAGGPINIACGMAMPTVESGNIMMSHTDIALLVATGGPGLVRAVLKSGKRGIGAGAGNPPALVDETADISAAARDIIAGATFDNNLPCIAEKAIVAIDKIADKLMEYMINQESCYPATAADLAALEKIVFTPKGLSRDCVGRSAADLLAKIGITAPNARCIVFEGAKDHPFIAEELMMPILGMVRARDFDDGLNTAKWLEGGNRHTAHIHSKHVDRITAYARALDTTILVKNAPSYAAIGYGGEGFCSFTIASTTGDGVTSAASFTKQRRCVMSDALSIR